MGPHSSIETPFEPSAAQSSALTAFEGLPALFNKGDEKPLTMFEVVGAHSELSLVDTRQWDERRLDLKFNVKALYCDDKQRQAIQHIHELGSAGDRFARIYSSTTGSQNKAQQTLRAHNLDAASVDMQESRWSVAWSRQWKRRHGVTVKRIVYQCVCGYDTHVRQRGNKRTPSTIEQPAEDLEDWQRRAAYEYTGCLAHADVTIEYTEPPNVLRIVGYLNHNDACLNSSLVRHPPIPLHSHVIEVAIRQLRVGASITAIQDENIRMCATRAYRDQITTNPTTANHRYEILRTDFCRIYRRYYRDRFDIDVSIPAEHNLHNWLDPSSPHYKPTLAEAVFHYSARSTENERLKVCISTNEMREATWKYVHGKQLALDGTFGLCTSRLLVFIALGVDEKNRGFPVAVFLFSAPTGSKATHAGYDTSVLVELLQSWKDSMGKGPDGAEFEPSVAITDTDTKERGALVKVWKSIHLLLCKFHTRQCWTNKRMAISRDDSGWGEYVRKQLHQLEDALLDTTDHSVAKQLVLMERREFENLSRYSQPEAKKAATAGLDFLDYLDGYWMPKDMWISWSQAGKILAAERTGLDISMILPTTNHLEALNFSLKRNILPLIYARHRLLATYLSWKDERFRAAAGGLTLSESSLSSTTATSSSKPPFVPRAWYHPDHSRDSLGRILFQSGKLKPISSQRPHEYWAICESVSLPQITDSGEIKQVQYWLTVHPSGAASCTCQDWLHRGGACKHLRAFRLCIESWMKEHLVPFQFRFPSTPEDAVDVEAKNRAWYGPQYANALTSPPPMAIVSYAGSSHHIPMHMQPPNLPLASGKSDDGGTLDASILPPPAAEHIAPSIVHEAELQAAISPATQEGYEDSEALVESVVDNGTVDDGEHNVEQNSSELNNPRAIQAQLQQQLDYEVKRILPSMYGILNDLDHPNAQLNCSAALREFRQVITSVLSSLPTAGPPTGELSAPTQQISATTSGNSVNGQDTAQYATQACAAATPLKRSVNVLPPSPEKKQKRKKSYKTF
ncbi:hypothetical protein EIP91_001145 [Steccherinum ochraceum]|uniref:SWIM-type domain-containing protein n=1 Tax=Steccherinum ochraceum TaxID=92696 RepID=A0A4R0RRW2_9APHY|nr:hypothetical protein EIP91_001145 [Steccherinum ochraceum]